MRYNTGNPVGTDGSSSPFDLHDNAGVFDLLINGPLSEYLSRLGAPLKSWRGIMQQVTEYLIAQGYESVYLVYGAGVVVERQTQLVQRSGELYRVMNAADIPLTLSGTWATDAPKLQAVGDAALRTLLASNSGAASVGTSRGVTVETELTNLGAEIDVINGDITDLQVEIDNISDQVGAVNQALGKAGCYNLFSQGDAGDILMIGDSNSVGNGQSNGYPGSLMGRFSRALLNNFDKQPGTGRGYMYHVWLNAAQQLANEPGWSQSGGSAVAGGPGGGAWRMPSGAYAEVTGRQVTQAKVFYAPSTSGATMTVYVNGTPAGSFTVSNTGLSSNINLAAGGSYIAPTDVVRFTCTGGSIDVYGFRTMRAGGSRGPIVYCSPEGSQTFADYTNPTRADLLIRYTKGDQPSAPKLVIVLLGTNSMIGAVGKQQTPASYVASMQALVDYYRAQMPDCFFLFWVPPKPDVTLPLANYAEYVTAIVAWAETQVKVELLRMDLTEIRGADFFASPDPVPGVHYNTFGHAAIAKVLCEYFGVRTDMAWPAF